MKRADALRVEESKKTETEMGGLREERFGGSGRMRVRDRGSEDGCWRRQ